MDELRSQIDEEALHALDFNPASKETVKDYLEILKAQFKVGSERKQVGLVLDGLPGKQARLLKDEAGGDLDWLTLLPSYLHKFKAASMATHKLTCSGPLPSKFVVSCRVPLACCYGLS